MAPSWRGQRFRSISLSPCSLKYSFILKWNLSTTIARTKCMYGRYFNVQEWEYQPAKAMQSALQSYRRGWGGETGKTKSWLSRTKLKHGNELLLKFACLCVCVKSTNAWLNVIFMNISIYRVYHYVFWICRVVKEGSKLNTLSSTTTFVKSQILRKIHILFRICWTFTREI